MPSLSRSISTNPHWISKQIKMDNAGQKHIQQLVHQRRFWMLPEVHRNMSNCWKVMGGS